LIVDKASLKRFTHLQISRKRLIEIPAELIW
jgi:hypothetical protein